MGREMFLVIEYGFGNEIGKFGNDCGIGNAKGIKKEIYFEAWE